MFFDFVCGYGFVGVLFVYVFLMCIVCSFDYIKRVVFFAFCYVFE